MPPPLRHVASSYRASSRVLASSAALGPRLRGPAGSLEHRDPRAQRLHQPLHSHFSALHRPMGPRRLQYHVNGHLTSPRSPRQATRRMLEALLRHELPCEACSCHCGPGQYQPALMGPRLPAQGVQSPGDPPSCLRRPLLQAAGPRLPSIAPPRPSDQPLPVSSARLLQLQYHTHPAVQVVYSFFKDV